MAGFNIIFVTCAEEQVFEDLYIIVSYSSSSSCIFEASLGRLRQGISQVNKLGDVSLESVCEASGKASCELREFKMIMPRRIHCISREVEILKTLTESGCNVPIYYDSWTEIKKGMTIMEHCELTLTKQISRLRTKTDYISEIDINEFVCQGIF